MVKSSDAGECQSLSISSRCCKLSPRISILATRPVECLVFLRLQQLCQLTQLLHRCRKQTRNQHTFCELLHCEEQPSVTCWPAQDPEGEPHDPQCCQGRQEGHQGREGQHQGAERAQGLQHRHPEVGEGSEAKDSSPFIVLKIIVNYFSSFEPSYRLLQPRLL